VRPVVNNYIRQDTRLDTASLFDRDSCSGANRVSGVPSGAQHTSRSGVIGDSPGRGRDRHRVGTAGEIPIQRIRRVDPRRRDGRHFNDRRTRSSALHRISNGLHAWQSAELMGVLLFDRFALGPSPASTFAGFAYHFWNDACFGIIFTLGRFQLPAWWRDWAWLVRCRTCEGAEPVERSTDRSRRRRHPEPAAAVIFLSSNRG